MTFASLRVSSPPLVFISLSCFFKLNTIPDNSIAKGIPILVILCVTATRRAKLSLPSRDPARSLVLVSQSVDVLRCCLTSHGGPLEVQTVTDGWQQLIGPSTGTSKPHGPGHFRCDVPVPWHIRCCRCLRRLSTSWDLAAVFGRTSCSSINSKVSDTRWISQL